MEPQESTKQSPTKDPKYFGQIVGSTKKGGIFPSEEILVQFSIKK